jgi:hypothetical protein
MILYLTLRAFFSVLVTRECGGLLVMCGGRSHSPNWWRCTVGEGEFAFGDVEALGRRGGLTHRLCGKWQCWLQPPAKEARP